MTTIESQRGVLTVPNALTVMRIAGSFVLVWLAWAGNATAFVVLYAVLLSTDWLDGKLAILLDQRTELGARLDSVGDAVLYACLIAGIGWLEPAFIRSEAILLAALLASYAVTVGVALVRFGRLPAYHTRAAKTCWLLVTIGAMTLLVGGPWWPARIAIVAVIVANIEATAISFVLDRWEADVTSIWHAVRRNRRRPRE